jgi:hypothetical protein
MPCGLTGNKRKRAQSERGSYVEISLENNACRFGPVSRHGVRFCTNVVGWPNGHAWSDAARRHDEPDA